MILKMHVGCYNIQQVKASKKILNIIHIGHNQVLKYYIKMWKLKRLFIVNNYAHLILVQLVIIVRSTLIEGVNIVLETIKQSSMGWYHF